MYRVVYSVLSMVLLDQSSWWSYLSIGGQVVIVGLVRGLLGINGEFIDLFGGLTGGRYWSCYRVHH